MNYFIDLNPICTDKCISPNEYNMVDDKSEPLINNMRMFLVTQFEKYKIDFKTCDVDKDVYGTLGLNLDGTRLTCDYLGPSTYYASHKKMANEDILKYVISTREFGGHIIWPSKLTGIGRFGNNGNEIMKSINTARSYCLRERLDYTLYEIKRWYFDEKDKGTKIFQMVLEANSNWFNKFGKGEDGYNTFIKVFAFQDCIDPISLNPYDFESYKGCGYNEVIEKKKKYIDSYIPQDLKTYKNYIEGTVYAIQKRDNTIKNSHKSFQKF